MAASAHLNEQEYRSLVVEYNDSAAPYPSDNTIVQLFEAQVARTPQGEAIRLGSSSLTYRELNERANRFAAYLQSLGAGPERLVVLYMDHSIEVVCAILGVLKSGAAYVPLDPASTPSERLVFILQDIAEGSAPFAVTPILITQPNLEKAVPPETAKVIVFASGLPALDAFPSGNPPATASPENLAYVIYTSGSTGKPKGVLIERRSLVNYIWWASRSYCHGEGLVWPLFSSLAFDLTVTSIFTPLISGGTIVIYRDDNARRGLSVLRVIEEGIVDIVKLTPSHLAMIKDMDLAATRIRKLIVGGEDFKTDLALEVTEKFGHAVEIYNEYGPTETTVGCMIHRFDPHKDRAASVPIGIPAANTGLYILDERLAPVPPGVTGEMFIAGNGLARGYLNRPELTAQKFLDAPDPRRNGAGSLRLYKTGDLARWSADGRMDFLGRADFQVKINGLRIELGEIEARLLAHHQISECVVDVNSSAGQLIAYYVSSNPISADELRAHLSKNLPGYMVPTRMVWLARLPLTSNGKVDRNALAFPGQESLSGASGLVKPRTRTEQDIVSIWAEILHVNDVGISDDFFDLGGNSLLAVKLMARIRDEFGLTLPIAALFESSTLAALAAALDQAKAGGLAAD